MPWLSSFKLHLYSRTTFYKLMRWRTERYISSLTNLLISSEIFQNTWTSLVFGGNKIFVSFCWKYSIDAGIFYVCTLVISEELFKVYCIQWRIFLAPVWKFDQCMPVCMYFVCQKSYSRLMYWRTDTYIIQRSFWQSPHQTVEQKAEWCEFSPLSCGCVHVQAKQIKKVNEVIRQRHIMWRFHYKERQKLRHVPIIVKIT